MSEKYDQIFEFVMVLIVSVCAIGGFIGIIVKLVGSE